jgi:hypothetical protein
MDIRVCAVTHPTRNNQHNQALTAHSTAIERCHPHSFPDTSARKLPGFFIRLATGLMQLCWVYQQPFRGRNPA